MKKHLLGVALLALGMSAHAFEADGYRSGMTREQVAAAVAASGFELYKNENALGDGWFAARVADDRRSYSAAGAPSFTFCDERLTAYVQSGPAQNYPVLIELNSTKYGTSTKTDVIRSNVAGLGSVSTVRTSWYIKGNTERIMSTLSLRPADANVSDTSAQIYRVKSRCDTPEMPW